MSRPRLTSFVDPRSGERRELLEPDAPATGRQLARLNREGRLELVEHAEPVSKSEAAYAIDEAEGNW